jgi:Cysteine rich repeat
MIETRFAGLLLTGAVVAGLIMSGGDGSSAQGGETPPCADEIEKDCGEVKPGGGRIIACLKEHESELSALCKDKIEKVAERAKELERACAEDVERFCKDVQPGRGRIAKCLRERKSELSAVCTEKLAETRKRSGQ